jgi:hypothetical protein
MFVWDKLERKEKHKGGELIGVLKADTGRKAWLETGRREDGCVGEEDRYW